MGNILIPFQVRIDCLHFICINQSIKVVKFQLNIEGINFIKGNISASVGMK